MRNFMQANSWRSALRIWSFSTSSCPLWTRLTKVGPAWDAKSDSSTWTQEYKYWQQNSHICLYSTFRLFLSNVTLRCWQCEGFEALYAVMRTVVCLCKMRFSLIYTVSNHLFLTVCPLMCHQFALGDSIRSPDSAQCSSKSHCGTGTNHPTTTRWT